MVFYNNGMIGHTIKRSDELYRETIKRKIKDNRDIGDGRLHTAFIKNSHFRCRVGKIYRSEKIGLRQ